LCNKNVNETKKINELAVAVAAVAEESFESNASCDDPDCGQPECDIRRVIKELRTSRRVPTSWMMEC